MGKVTHDELHTFLATGASQAEAARHFQISQSAVHQRLKKQGHRNARVLALEHAGTIVEQRLDSSERLARVQGAIDELLDWALSESRRAGADRGELVDVILRLTAEVRAQLGLQLQISRALVDVKLIREFQQIVLAEISAEAPATAKRIINRLKERRSLRASCDLPGLTGSCDGV